ncbi:MAG TPA: hypothetical protein VF459_11560 [Caulobacteraceae bacterium]
MIGLVIAAEPLLQPDVTRLFGLAERYFDGLYPGETHRIDPASLAERGAVLLALPRDDPPRTCVPKLN